MAVENYWALNRDENNEFGCLHKIMSITGVIVVVRLSVRISSLVGRIG